MTHRTGSTIALTAALLTAAAPAARADVLETPVAGGAHFVAAAGWQAWSAADAAGTHRLIVRRPDGTVVTPDVPAFGAPVQAAIGTRGGADGINTPASRRLSAVYSRCAETSALAGCDVYALDLTRLTESRVPALASRTYSETVPSVASGSWSFVRRGGGPRPGTYHYSERADRLRRLSPTLARATSASQSRVLFTYNSSRGFGVQLRYASGKGGPIIAASRLATQPVSPQLTRYRAGFLLPGDTATRVLLSDRFAGSEFRTFPLNMHDAPRTLPASARSGDGDASRLFSRYLDAAGVQRIDPAIR